MHSSIDVANRLIELADADKKTLTPMQLIKLVFLCHGWTLGLHHRHLISDSIEAWRYGPVIPDLYQKIKHYKSNPVRSIQTSKSVDFHVLEEDIIKQVYNIYGHLNGMQLSTLTHQEGSPWDITRKHRGNSTISNDIIENYYQNQAQQK